MAVPPVAETNEERAVRLAMERDLGIERVESLPAEDGEKKGIKYSRAAADAVMSGPAVRAETNALWLSAIEAGDFDDDDAEGVKGLSTMAHGRLHAIRETTNSASPQQSSPSPAHLSSRASIAKKPAPYSPNHNPAKPPQLNNARHNITSQRPKRRRNVPSPTNGASRATAAKAASPGLTNKAAAPGPANKAGQHPLVQKKSQLSNGHRNTQPANSSLLRNSSSYNLGPTKPPSTSQLSNIVLDESVLCLQGETILYRDVALLHQQAGTKPLPSSVIWLASGNVAEPQFIVVVDNAILHEYPLSSWKTSWGTAPDRDIKFRDNLGIETTIRLTFINHTAVSLFVEKQDELATQFKKPSTMRDGSAQPKQTVSTMVPTTTGSHPPTDTGTPTKLKPSGTAKAAANTNETKTAPSNKSSSQKKAAAVVLQSSPALPGSKEASPPGVNVSKQRDAQSQTPDLSTSVPGPAEGSFSSSDIGGQLILLEDDRTAAVRGPSRDPRSSGHLQELHSLSPESPSSNALVLYDDQAHKTAAVDQAVTTDSVIAMCQAITVQVEQLTQVHIDMSRKARDAVRQRLDAGLSKSFRGIEDPKRSHVISTLMLLFDAATRHNGLRYSADEMHDLRSDAEPPRGHDYEQARKDLDDLGVMNPLRKSEVHKLQVAQVAAKQTEDTPGLQVESQAKAINASAAAGASSTLVDAESTEASTSLLAAAEISGADHSSPRITAVDTNVFGIETNDNMPCSVSATRALSLRRQSSRSNSVSSQVTQGGSRRVGLASSRWASGAATSNAHISASLISSSPVPNSPATTRSPPITSARPTTGSTSVMFSSRFAECIPRTSALFDLSSLEGGGGQSRVPSVESERSVADSTATVNALFTQLSLHSPAGDECQVPERRSLGRGVRNINIPVSERGLRNSDITLI
ncbi:hypothetical protein PpBr36_08176 [Pyricularia pennisetigena]|uniref:hypothetical protein n=1 Tax=Pyricularia pennisetigena TaxID=1578925 RepID=UPI0011541EC9|nr:hypothetical protein PpBr36_08176 [Pyricularia pennisetigena]TLS24113.1 hypothetical protein PpBr36_08176 [Pyricularia pennisetigena]